MGNYYTPEIISKFTEALKQNKDSNSGKISISHRNNKMGEVTSVSLLPFLTCPAGCKGTCASSCYAAKIANLRPKVLDAYARNTAILLSDPESYWRQVEGAIKMVTYFRYHVSGDIPNAEYFEQMVAIAERNPHCQMLVFTKRFEIVNSYLDAGRSIPSNLHILFSGWTNLKPYNPHNLPETNVWDKNNPPEVDWLQCGGNCFECACRGAGCWSVKNGQTIAFKIH